jgi:hypothetical protein
LDNQEQFEDKRFDALMKLAEFRLQRWRERRETDWKFTLALWTLMVAVGAYVVSHRADFEWRQVAIALAALVICHAWFWVRNNWLSNEMDIRTAFYFAEYAEKLVIPSGEGPRDKRLDPNKFRRCHRGFEFLAAGFPQVQVIGTLFFATAIVLLLVR